MKNRLVAALFALFLGGLGAHKFYLGDTNSGIGYLVFNIFGLFTTFFIIGFFILFILLIITIVDFIKLISMSDEEFDSKYNKKNLNCL